MAATSERAPVPLPVVIVTSVIRSTHQGQSHGGVYLLDLAACQYRQVIDWNDPAIDWEGRGGDRGLRGIAFWNQDVYLAASDEIFVYNSDFQFQRSFKNRYLKHCHEIFIDGDTLLLTATGFDSILAYDLRARRFTDGYCVRYATSSRVVSRGSRILTSGRWVWRPPPRLRHFDPNEPRGPHPTDTCHINSVTGLGGALYLSGTELAHLYCIRAGRLSRYAKIPKGSHNARRLGHNVVLNDTPNNRVVVQDRRGRPRAEFPIPSYQDDALTNKELAGATARQSFGRGLTVWKDRYVIAGSSPATISVHDLETGRTVLSMNLTMDVRNAVHGLEVWPFS